MQYSGRCTITPPREVDVNLGTSPPSVHDSNTPTYRPKSNQSNTWELASRPGVNGDYDFGIIYRLPKRLRIWGEVPLSPATHAPDPTPLSALESPVGCFETEQKGSECRHEVGM